MIGREPRNGDRECLPTSELRIGVIGLGGITRDQHLPAWSSYPGVRLVALVDTNATALETVGNEYPTAQRLSDWQTLLTRDDVDLIDITTPNRWHAPMTLAALAAGKHVLCEKPMALTAADAQAMVEAARQYRRALMIHHVFRFDPLLVRMKSFVDSGELGRIERIQARWTRRRMVPTAATFLSRDLAGGGPVFDLGVHLLDLALWLVEDASTTEGEVRARIGRGLGSGGEIGGDWGDWNPADYQVEDGGFGAFWFDNGPTIELEASWIRFQPKPEVRSLTILGSRGSAHWPSGTIIFERGRTPLDARISLAKREVEGPSVFRRAIHAFAKSLLEGSSVPVTPEIPARTIGLLEAFYRSAKEDRTVRFTGAS